MSKKNCKKTIDNSTEQLSEEYVEKLRKENARLELENEILRKVTAMLRKKKKRL